MKATKAGHQIDDGFALVPALQAQQSAGRRVPPFQGAVGIENQNALVQGVGDAADPGDQAEIVLAVAGVALAQPVEVIRDLAPDTGRRRRIIAAALLQPLIEVVDVHQGPEHVQRAAGDQCGQRIAADIAGQQSQGGEQRDALQLAAQPGGQHAAPGAQLPTSFSEKR
jgi:hypothetical protein